MLKWTLILTALMYVAPGSASAPIGKNSGNEITMASSGCPTCSGGGAMEALELFAQEMSAITDGALDIEIISDKMNYSQKCDNFVGNGEVNHWGDVINKELGKPKYSDLLEEGPKDIAQYCPKYKKMDVDDRKALFMLTVAAMAHYESSCNFREKAPGPNGTAAGLLQLHKGKEGRYSSGCRNGDSSNADRSLICGLSMLNDQTMERGERLFSSASYWEVLRPRGRSQKARKIMAAIKKFPACGAYAETKVSAKKAAPKKQAAAKPKSKSKKNRVASR